MARPPRLGFVITFLAVLLASGAGILFWGTQRILSAHPSRAARQQENRPKLVFPVQDEGAETAGLPLLDVIHGLDFTQDSKALLVFDLAMQTRLREGHYGELDDCALQMEKTRARFPGGGWQLYRMLDMLSNCPGGRDRSDAEWSVHLARFRDWIAKRPGSWTAREALAGALIDYAWKARGDGFARTVTDEGWQLNAERLQQAEAVLREWPVGGHHSPMWFYYSLVIDRGLSRSRGEYDDIFNAGIAEEPEFFGLYTEKAYDLLPRWDGERGEWERFASDVSDQVGGPKGDAIYFYITRSIYEQIGAKELFSDSLVDWNRMKKGWASLCSSYGTTNNNLNEYCLMAGLKGDHAEAVAMLDKIGNNWDPLIWKTGAKFYDFRDWARCQGKYAPKSAHP